MDIKAVTLEEAQAAQDFLENVPFESRGTIAAKYEMLSNLVSFQAKLAAAIKEEKSVNDETPVAPAD